MANVELKSQKLKEYVQRTLRIDSSKPITENDLNKITTLKLDKKIFQDLSIGDLVFFNKLSTLSLNNINVGNNEISILKRLTNIKTLSISNSTLSITDTQLNNFNLQHLIFENCSGLDLSKFNDNANVKNLTVINCKDAKLGTISNFEKIEKVNLANNEWLQDSDIENLWDSQTIKKVILDGNPNIKFDYHDGISISHESEYRPGESIDWSTNHEAKKSATLSNLSMLSIDDLKNINGQNIIITAADMDYINTPQGQQALTVLNQNNSINLSLKTTADLDLASLESLNKLCNINKVQVQTGWTATQDKGYSYETYVAIKKEILNIIDGIDSNLTDAQKYVEIRKRLTENIKYDYSATQTKPGDRDFYASRNLENGLLNHTCVCAGYADIFKNVLAEVGIDSKYVEGKTNTGELHAWNQIQLKGDDGKYHWYNDDITWDAVFNSAGKGQFNYSLMTDKEFSKTHTCIPSRTEGYGTQSCNAQPPLAARAAKNNRQANLDLDNQR